MLTQNLYNNDLFLSAFKLVKWGWFSWSSQSVYSPDRRCVKADSLTLVTANFLGLYVSI